MKFALLERAKSRKGHPWQWLFDDVKRPIMPERNEVIGDLPFVEAKPKKLFSHT